MVLSLELLGALTRSTLAKNKWDVKTPGIARQSSRGTTWAGPSVGRAGGAGARTIVTMEQLIRGIDLAVAASLVVVIITGVARRGRPRPLLVGGGAAAVALFAVALALEGLRWQLLALATAGAVVALLVAWTLRGERSRVLRGLSVTGALGVLVVLALAAWALPPALVPVPTGSLPVGVTSSTFTDPARGARGGPADGTVRSLPVTIWYPAADAGPGGPLIADDAGTTVDGLARQYGLPGWVLSELRDARGHATPDAPAREGAFPVVLFSPGLSSSRWLASSWASEVASHGAVVVALDHPFDAAAVTTADGAVVTSALAATGDAETDDQRAEEWVRVRAADLAALLDALAAQQASTPALAAADLEHVVAAGHSAGGASALLLASTDARVDGVVEVDGMPRSPAVDRGIPTVVLVAGDSGPNPEYARATDALVAAGAVRVTVDGVAHTGFTDVSLVLAPVPGVLGTRASAGPPTAAAATLAVVDAVERGVPLEPRVLAGLGAVG
jgi:dienelactone hydrolase